MNLLIVFLLSFGMGLILGASTVIRQVQAGRLVAGGRVYSCKDTGPWLKE